MTATDDSRSGGATAVPPQKSLRVCVLGLGGGGFHWEAQRILQVVDRPLSLVLVYAGPKGGLIYWKSKDEVRSQYIVRSPSLTGDGFFARVSLSLYNIWEALRIIRKEKPDLVLAAGTAQAIPFGIAARLLGSQLWFVESVTRAMHPSRTAKWVHRLRLSSRFYYYWRTFGAQFPRGICMERERT